MGSVGRNRSWTTEIHHMDTLFLEKQRFHDNLKHSAHARHLVLHLRTTADKRSQVSWFFLLCLPSPLLNMNNRWGCDLPKYFFAWKSQRIVRHYCSFCNFCQCKIVAVVLYQRTSSPGLNFMVFHLMKFKISKALPRALLVATFSSSCHINSSLSHSHE